MKKHIFIIGGRFAGVNLIKDISRNKNFRITLVDRSNYHFFPPLICQVTTALIELSYISYPFCKLFSNYDNEGFHMGSLLKINTDIQQIETDTRAINYDYWVVALGTEAKFFGLENVKNCALPMKTIHEALYLKESFIKEP